MLGQVARMHAGEDYLWDGRVKRGKEIFVWGTLLILQKHDNSLFDAGSSQFPVPVYKLSIFGICRIPGCNLREEKNTYVMFRSRQTNTEKAVSQWLRIKKAGYFLFVCVQALSLMGPFFSLQNWTLLFLTSLFFASCTRYTHSQSTWKQVDTAALLNRFGWTAR